MAVRVVHVAASADVIAALVLVDALPIAQVESPKAMPFKLSVVVGLVLDVQVFPSVLDHKLVEDVKTNSEFANAIFPLDNKVVATGDQETPLFVDRQANGVKLLVATITDPEDATRLHVPELAVVTTVQVIAFVEVKETPEAPTTIQRVPS